MVAPFERLHPALQHHLVNSLGWRTLRPHQEQAIEPILAGEHVLIQAPTAGGKTEAAVLPTLSRMLSEGWGAPGVLYLCPIKALLNDLEGRLERLAGLVGRRVAVWHGDVGQSARRRIMSDPPDLLLATPESVEVMLVSRLVDHRRLFANLRAVIVDEVHAFAGDDRGWHLLALLERLSALSPHPVQRIALSATLSNASDLLRWLVASERTAPQRVVAGHSAAAEAEVKIDFVGNLANAALVISRLHQGEKRLVFCDSRSRVEELAQGLRLHGTETYVSHSSLSVEERRRAEAAFSQGSDCVIVATSTLELGIDVGDLDRVIQIDAPFSIAAFLQRLGRSGRRAGGRRNCLFLATNGESLLRALGVLHLWREGFVEPVIPPALPYHVLAQQILAVVLQEGGVDRVRLGEWLGGWGATAGLSADTIMALVTQMLELGVLFDDGGLIGIGREGEVRYGAKNFLEIFSIFNTPPLFTVYHGLTEVGQVDELTFRRRHEGPIHLSLGGRGWKVTHLDWRRKRAYVEVADQHGRSRWQGSGQSLHFHLAQAIRHVLYHGLPEHLLSRRAVAELEEIREEFAWLSEGVTTLSSSPEEQVSRWWTFAGDRYNAAAAERLVAAGYFASADGLAVSVVGADHVGLGDEVARVIADLAADPTVTVADGAEKEIKFADSLPVVWLVEMLGRRLGPREEAEALGRQRFSSRQHLS